MFDVILSDVPENTNKYIREKKSTEGKPRHPSLFLVMCNLRCIISYIFCMETPISNKKLCV